MTVLARLPENWHAFAKARRPVWMPLVWNNPPAEYTDPPILGDVYEIQGRGRPQYYVVVGIADQGIKPSQWSGEPRRDVALAVTKLTGDPKKAFEIWPWHDYKSIARRTRFDLPVWSGSQARKLYEVYVDMLKKLQGDTVQPMPFQEAQDLIEPKVDLPTNDALPVPRDWNADTFEADQDEEGEGEGFYADVTIRHMADEGTVALYDRKADRKRPREESVYHALRRAGFVVAHQAGGILRRTNSVGYPQSVLELEPNRAHNLKHDLNKRGFKVAFDFSAAPLEEAKRLRAGYLRDRGERFAQRAERLRTESARQAALASDQQEQALAVIPLAGYFPTPQALADRAVALAALEPHHRVLDPSAGKGDLLEAGRRVAPATFEAVEIATQLQPVLRERGFPVLHHDALDPAFDPGTVYDRVLINPPFEQGASIDHVRRAWEFVKPGGRLVAILPESIWYRTDRKHQAFRDWFTDLPHHAEKQEPQKFGRSGDISTRILVLDKPAHEPAREARPLPAPRIQTPPTPRVASSRAEQRAEERAERAKQRAKQLAREAADTERGSQHLLSAADAGGKGFAYERGITPEDVQRERSKVKKARTAERRAAERERVKKDPTLHDQLVALLRKKALVGADRVKKGWSRPPKASAYFAWNTDETYTDRWSDRERPGMRVLFVEFEVNPDGETIKARALKRNEALSRHGTQQPPAFDTIPATIEAATAWFKQHVTQDAGELTARDAFDR